MPLGRNVLSNWPDELTMLIGMDLTTEWPWNQLSNSRVMPYLFWRRPWSDSNANEFILSVHRDLSTQRRNLFEILLKWSGPCPCIVMCASDHSTTSLVWHHEWCMTRAIALTQFERFTCAWRIYYYFELILATWAMTENGARMLLIPAIDEPCAMLCADDTWLIELLVRKWRKYDNLSLIKAFFWTWLLQLDEAVLEKLAIVTWNIDHDPGQMMLPFEPRCIWKCNTSGWPRRVCYPPVKRFFGRMDELPDQLVLIDPLLLSECFDSCNKDCLTNDHPVDSDCFEHRLILTILF